MGTKNKQNRRSAALVVRSVSDAIEALSDKKVMDNFRPRANNKRGDDYFGLWFRGHESLKYTLTPTMLRSTAPNTTTYLDEVSLTRHFKAMNPDAGPADGNDFDWAVGMQHYLAPTRLLDWTENLLVALYFAVRDPERDNQEDAAVWILNARRLNYYTSATTRHSEVAFPDDPDVIARASLARARERHEWKDVVGREFGLRRHDRTDFRAERILTAIADVEVLNKAIRPQRQPAIQLRKYSDTVGTRKEPMNVMTKEVWGEPEAIYARLRMPVAVYPRRANSRIRSQSGVFTLHGGNFHRTSKSGNPNNRATYAVGTPIDILDLNDRLTRTHIVKWLRIPKNCREGIRSTLAKIGVTDASLFPELDYQSRYLADRWTPAEEEAEED